MFVRGSLFDSKAHALVNPVNTRGVMGAGLALEFRKRYPSMFLGYRERCDYGEVTTGMCYPYRVSEERTVINFPTKDHWRNPSEMSYIEGGLSYLVANYEAWGIRSVSLPFLGCGLGGLPRRDVVRVMTKWLGRMSIPVEVRWT